VKWVRQAERRRAHGQASAVEDPCESSARARIRLARIRADMCAQGDLIFFDAVIRPDTKRACASFRPRGSRRCHRSMMSEAKEIDSTLRRAWKWHNWRPAWVPLRVQGIVRRVALGTSPSSLIQAQLANGCFIYVDPTDFLQCHIGVRGEWEGDIYSAVRPLIQEGDCVLDLGAHVGYSSLLFAEWVGQKGSVFSFEPFVPHVERIKANLELNGFGNIVTVVAAGVSDSDGSFDFYPPAQLNAGVGSFAASGRRGKRVSVPTIELDRWLSARSLENVAFCKMDVEGAEGPALKGLRKTLDRQMIGSILLELHPVQLFTLGFKVPQLLDALDRSGYELFFWNQAGRFTREPMLEGEGYVLAVTGEKARLIVCT